MGFLNQILIFSKEKLNWDKYNPNLNFLNYLKIYCFNLDYLDQFGAASSQLTVILNLPRMS